MGNAVGDYFRTIGGTAKALLIGLGVTIKYFFRPDTVITVQYPHEMDKLPERHRGIHFLETEKCIMCSICAKACPVDCIYIEGTRDGEIQGAYQGDKAVMTQFVIDYSLCIMCNLCCEPCPRDCIHMGQEFHLTGTERQHAYKNLLEDRLYTREDDAWVKSMRPEIVRLAEEKKKAKAAAIAAKKKAAEAKKSEAAREAAEAKSPEPPKAEEKPPDPLEDTDEKKPEAPRETETPAPEKKPEEDKAGGDKPEGEKP